MTSLDLTPNPSPPVEKDLKAALHPLSIAWREGRGVRLKSEWLFIVALLLFAAGLRFIGLAYGQPDPRYDHSGLVQGLINANTPIHPDEFLFITRPLQMLLTRQYNPKFFHNPSFLNNVNFVTFWLTDAGNGLSLEDRQGVNGRSYAPFHLYIIGRTYSALGGIIAVAATYAATRRIGGRFAAAIAGLLTAVSLPMVQHAHYTTTSSLAAGFAAVAVWATFVSVQGKRRWMFWLAGIAAGFAAGNRYNAALVGIVVFLVGLVLLYRDSSQKMRRAVLVGWLLVPVIFVFTTPWIIFDTAFFLDELRYILNQYISGAEIQFTTPNGLWFEYQYLIVFAIGAPAALALLVGLYAAWQARPRRGNFFRQNSTLLFVLMLIAYLLVYSIVNLRTVRPALSDQMLVPVIPQFALLAGLGAGWLYERLPISRHVLAPTLTLSLIVIPLAPSVQLVYQFAQPDTRQFMQQWVYERIPRGAHIHLLGPYNVPLDAADYTWTQNFAQNLIPLEQLRGDEPLDAPLQMMGDDDFELVEQLQPGQIDYIILSDAWYFSVERTEYAPPDYAHRVRDYLATFDQSLTEIARIERPVWTGYDWLMQSASYWHNPGLMVYCMDTVSCAAVR